MLGIQEFRKYYNASLYHLLRRLERSRRWLVALFVLSILASAGLIVLVIRAHIPTLSLFAALPISLFSTFLFYRMRRFKAIFKPPVVDHILAFLDLNMRYDYQGIIPRERFWSSGLFTSAADYYRGEDYFCGTLGRTVFEMCELDVRQTSRVRSGYEPVFRGVFFHANFQKPFNGKILIFPREDRPHHMRSIKRLLLRGGQEINVPNEEFDDIFVTYASANVHTEGLEAQEVYEGNVSGMDAGQLLSPEIYEALLNYHYKIDKKLCIAFIEDDIYIAIHNPKDILEPNIFRSNTSFRIVREFYVDLRDILRIVEAFETHH